MKIAILGGSFNPIHIGHAMLADTIIKELGYDKVLFIPTGIPPHKELSAGATTENRLQMVKNFCDSVPGGIFEMEPCEVERGGISYTVDTLTYIVNKYKNVIDGKPALLMGTEIAAEFHKWKNVEKIVEIADLIIVPRYPDVFGMNCDFKNKPSGHYAGDFNTRFDARLFPYDCKILDIPILPVSSTEIRGRIASGKSFEYLLPHSVCNYIKENNLYKIN